MGRADCGYMLAKGSALTGAFSRAIEERRAVVDFPAAHYACTIVLLCRAGDLGLDVPPQAPGGPAARLAQGLEKTLLREGRWKLIAQGLAVTLEITFCAALAGTALGFGLYLVRCSRWTPARRAAEALCTFLQGVPGLVVLMALYFVVFGSVRIRPAAVGSLTFAILFAVTVSGILSAGIGGVDKGQWEAAGALGFGRAGAFFRVILPQAAGRMLPRCGT